MSGQQEGMLIGIEAACREVEVGGGRRPGGNQPAATPEEGTRTRTLDSKRYKPMFPYTEPPHSVEGHCAEGLRRSKRAPVRPES